MLNKGYRRATIQTDNLDVVQALTDIRLEIQVSPYLGGFIEL
ncbi:hypothetical protein Goshw_020195 [Gossypium schwendimanii]|uniref:RNase H type-1 domain-containing protein n=2 Tax=Gossypium TaxID=3633 RepID=A0A7J9F6L3_9ROSI|nr:hypothetical protein [Gossypium trilobum]MBA0871020.1 hypothetical protein [Gossypium schwendimanii]